MVMALTDYVSKVDSVPAGLLSEWLCDRAGNINESLFLRFGITLRRASAYSRVNIYNAMA